MEEMEGADEEAHLVRPTHTPTPTSSCRESRAASRSRSARCNSLT